MPTRYTYTTLWYQPALGVSTAEPFAVFVESHTDTVREVFGILKRLPSDESTVTGHVLANLPEILTERLYAAAERGGMILDVLREELAWNIYADTLAQTDSDLPLRHVAYSLFAQYVDVDRVELTRFQREHIDGAAVGTQYTIDLVA